MVVFLTSTGVTTPCMTWSLMRCLQRATIHTSSSTVFFMTIWVEKTDRVWSGRSVRARLCFSLTSFHHKPIRNVWLAKLRSRPCARILVLTSTAAPRWFLHASMTSSLWRVRAPASTTNTLTEEPYFSTTACCTWVTVLTYWAKTTLFSDRLMACDSSETTMTTLEGQRTVNFLRALVLLGTPGPPPERGGPSGSGAGGGPP